MSIITKKGFGNLVREQVAYLKEAQLSLSIKKTVGQHVTRVGFIIGPNIEYAN